MKTWYSIIMYEKGSRKMAGCWTVQANNKGEALKNLAVEGVNVYNNDKYYFEVEDGKAA